MNTANLMHSLIAAAILAGVYHFSKNQQVKAAVLGAAGVIVAKQVPYLKDALA